MGRYREQTIKEGAVAAAKVIPGRFEYAAARLDYWEAVAKAVLDASDYGGAVGEVERLRGINRELVRAHNALLAAVVKSEFDAEALHDHFGGGAA